MVAEIVSSIACQINSGHNLLGKKECLYVTEAISGENGLIAEFHSYNAVSVTT